ncbi:ABC transporter permease [Carboxydochorda subterranea]|uniref:ABC transporter permease n=1 Tax=Carboxydichorda subterranea TaxID=3109565 RepID=A0ABZ1C1P6_9FIRM|nr:ABC transporter permease [Limnochorda sp. L945t]WRP18765.1 ABC transporter permease [Limnochorda sp. L945t]
MNVSSTSGTSHPPGGWGASLRRTQAVAVRVMRQLWRDRRTLALMFVIPVLLMLLITYLLEGPSEAPTVAVVAPTQRLAGWAVQHLVRPAAGDRWTVIDAGADDPETVVRAGRASAVLVVPGDLLSAPLQGRAPSFEVVVEGAEYGTTGRILSDLRAVLPAMAGRVGAMALGPLGAAAGTGGPTAAPGTGLPFRVRYVYGGPGMKLTDHLAPGLLAYLAFFFVFLLTAAAFLRERQRGTLVRMPTSPLRPGEVVAGYMAGFSLLALAQAAVVVAVVVWGLGVQYRGSLAWVVVVELLVTLGASSLGIFLSTFARNELQVMQFIPLVIIPQALLCGLIVSVQLLPGLLRLLAYIMPLTYATTALTDVMIRGLGGKAIWAHLAALAAFAAVFVVLAARAVRRV